MVRTQIQFEPRQYEALLGLAGIGDSGLADLGRAHDRYLDEDDKR